MSQNLINIVKFEEKHETPYMQCAKIGQQIIGRDIRFKNTRKTDLEFVSKMETLF